jgi:type III secretion protein HrpB1
MEQPEKAYLDCPPDVIGGLIELTMSGLLDDFPSLSANKGDIAMVIDALHILRPNVAELAVLNGMLHMASKNWFDAARCLREVCTAAPTFAHSKALLAYSLNELGDWEWRHHAEEALSLSSGPETQRLIQVLFAREDLHQARERAKTGEAFTIPESVSAVIAKEGGGAAPSASTIDEAEPSRSIDTSNFCFPRA